MTTSYNLNAVLAELHFLDGRDQQTSAEQEEEAFASLGQFGHGEMYAGGFAGQSPWEIHRNGDELVQVLKGSTKLTILLEHESEEHSLVAGSLIVVPQGCWHRFDSPEGVSVMTITPGPTEHSEAEDPRLD